VHDFHGTIHLLDEPDQVLDAKVTVDLNRVLVRADGAEIGSWRHADVEVQKSEDGIHMTADGETLVLNMENRDLLLDLLGGTESGGKRRKKRRRKPAPDPAPPAAEVASSQYSAEDAVAANFNELRAKSAAGYHEESRISTPLAIGLGSAALLVLVGAALNWGPFRLLDSGSFPVGRLLAGLGGVAALVGLYLAYFDRRRTTGSAVAIAAGSVILAVVYFYTRAARMGIGFMLALLGAIALIVVGAVGMSDYGVNDEWDDNGHD
jgi:hypothetical protein